MIHENNGPVFPVVIFPENIRKIIDATHEESCFPVNYIAAALFFAASVAVGNFRTLEANSFKAKAHLFMALLGSPGSGKTHPINFAIAPFLELDKESIKEYQKKLNEWRKAPDGAKVTNRRRNNFASRTSPWRPSQKFSESRSEEFSSSWMS